MASTNQDTIHTLFAQEKVAQETTKMMSTLGLLDADALAVSFISTTPFSTQIVKQNGLAKMVPVKPVQPSFPTNGGGPPGQMAPQQFPPFAQGNSQYPAPDARGSYNAPPPNPTGWYGAQPAQPTLPRGPPAAAPIPGIQNLSADEAVGSSCSPLYYLMKPSEYANVRSGNVSSRSRHATATSKSDIHATREWQFSS